MTEYKITVPHTPGTKRFHIPLRYRGRTGRVVGSGVSRGVNVLYVRFAGRRKALLPVPKSVLS